MTFPSDLRPFSVLSRIKAITVLKRDTTKVEIRPRLLACHGVVLKWVHRPRLLACHGVVLKWVHHCTWYCGTTHKSCTTLTAAVFFKKRVEHRTAPKKIRTCIREYLMPTPKLFYLGYTVPHSIPSGPINVQPTLSISKHSIQVGRINVEPSQVIAS